MWDEAAHSEPTEEEKSRKNISNVIYAVGIKKKRSKSILLQSFLKSSYVTCVQRSLQLRRNYSNIGYVYTLLL